MRIAYHSYLATTLDYRESCQIEPADLAALVARLRAGDKSVAHTIIKGHYRLAAGIVGGAVRSRKKSDDCLGAALLALVKAVNDAPTALTDNNITAYITTCVRYAIKDEMANFHVVRVSPRTIRHRLARGEEFADIVPFDRGGVGESDPREDVDPGSFKGRGFTLPYAIPLAKPEISLEFKEAAERAPQGPMEQAIFKLYLDGNTYSEIGRKVGYCHQRIGQIVPPIIARFAAIY